MVETEHVLLTAAFWADTFERVVTAVAAVILGMMGNNVVNPSDIDWGQFCWTVGITAVGRLLLCIVARTTGDKSVPNASFFLTSGRHTQ